LEIAGTFIGCGPTMGFPQGERGEEWSRQSLRLSTFDKLWEERTISLSQGGGGSRIPLFSSLEEGGMGEQEAFPLFVRATFVDSGLIEAGIKEFGRLAKMSDEELVDYRARYKAAHDFGHNLYVWVELRTALSEEYLKLGRWTIFLEGEQRHQFDPARIVEHARAGDLERSLTVTQNESEGFPGARYQGRSLLTKDVELYFPMSQLTGEPILSPATKTLKLVILQADNPNVRAEGAWDFSTFEKKQHRSG
jgi:hypothetical protein